MAIKCSHMASLVFLFTTSVFIANGRTAEAQVLPATHAAVCHAIEVSQASDISWSIGVYNASRAGVRTIVCPVIFSPLNTGPRTFRVDGSLYAGAKVTCTVRLWNPLQNKSTESVFEVTNSSTSFSNWSRIITVTSTGTATSFAWMTCDMPPLSPLVTAGLSQIFGIASLD